MTTRVVVEPAGHVVEIVTLDASNTGPATSLVLKPGDPPFDVYIHSARCLVIRELPTAP
jgi:hypothetical protein